jgi:hypothetical protein
MHNEAVLFKFEAISLHLPERTEENKENNEHIQKRQQTPGRELKPQSPEYKARVLDTQP